MHLEKGLEGLGDVSLRGEVANEDLEGFCHEERFYRSWFRSNTYFGTNVALVR
jgi:hypothetical protein